jgi:ABC-type multidrug transport system fused ATPase/permease subunit
MVRQASQIFIVIFMIGFVSPIFLIMLLPLSFFYKNTQSVFRSSMREFQRLKGITKSPILSLYQESFNGLPIIRSYKREQDFQAKNIDNINLHNIPLYNIMAAEKWFAIRLDFIGIHHFQYSLLLYIQYSLLYIEYSVLYIEYSVL